MSMLLDAFEGILGLTDAEKADLAACLPAVQADIDAIDAQISDIIYANQIYVSYQNGIVKKLLADWQVIGPNVSALISGGYVDIAGTMAAINDAHAILSTPILVNQYQKLLPLITKLHADWPTLKKVWDIVDGALKRKGITVIEVIKLGRDL
jgi:hypothetical protein